MIIKLQPQINPNELVIVKKGDVLTINGEVFDFSPLPKGATLPIGSITSLWILGAVDRDDEGVISFRTLFPVEDFETHAQAFPEDLVNVPDGIVQFPKADPKPEPEVIEPIFQDSLTEEGLADE